MGLFKKKKNIDSKYKYDERVHFTINEELFFGVIINIKKENDINYYDIQIGGEAPSVKYHVEENKIFK